MDAHKTLHAIGHYLNAKHPRRAAAILEEYVQERIRQHDLQALDALCERQRNKSVWMGTTGTGMEEHDC